MEKITFYDLIGFIFPGSVILIGFIIMNNNAGWYPLIKCDSTLFLFEFFLLLMAYIVGFAIHSLSEIIYRRNKDNNNLLWKLKWITQAIDNLKKEKKDSMLQFFAKENIDYRSEYFQTKVWTQMHSQVCEQKNYELKALNAQSTMLANASVSFGLLAIAALPYIYFYEQYSFWYSLLKYELPLILFTISCFRLAVGRKKAIIRTVIWSYSINKDVKSLN